MLFPDKNCLETQFEIKVVNKSKMNTFSLLFELILALSMLKIEAKSSKKGVCIPPGTNFHCRDLAQLHNARYIYKAFLLQQGFRKKLFSLLLNVLYPLPFCILAGGTTGTWLQIMTWPLPRTTAPVMRGHVDLNLETSHSSPWSGATTPGTCGGMTTSTTRLTTSTTSSSASMSPIDPTGERILHQKKLLRLGLNYKTCTLIKWEIMIRSQMQVIVSLF